MAYVIFPDIKRCQRRWLIDEDRLQVKDKRPQAAPMRALVLLLPLAACAEPDPEVVNTLTWPVRVPGLLTEDLRLALRETEIARAFRANPSAVLAELDAQGGPVLSAAFGVAGIPPAAQDELIAELALHRPAYAADIDRLARDIARAGRSEDLMW